MNARASPRRCGVSIVMRTQVLVVCRRPRAVGGSPPGRHGQRRRDRRHRRAARQARAWCCAPWPPARNPRRRPTPTAVIADRAGRGHLSRDRHARRLRGSGAHGRRDSADQTARSCRAARAGRLTSAVSVTAARAEREIRQIPLHVETITARRHRAVEPALDRRRAGQRGQRHAGRQRPVRRAAAPARAGLDAHAGARRRRAPEHRAPGHRPHRRRGRPRSPPTACSRIEIVNGAGTLLYGSDALAGTINIVTNEPTFSPTTRWIYGFNGYYSSNENGRRGTVTLGATTPRYAFRVQGGAEDVRQLQGRQPRRRGHAAVLHVRPHPTAATPSTTTSASRACASAPFPIRSTRRTCAPTTRCPTRRPTATSSSATGPRAAGREPRRCACATSAGT